MKKFLLSLGMLGMFGGLIGIVSAASNDCKEVEFSSSVSACVNIEDAGTNRRKVVTTLDGGSTGNLKCDIMGPDSGMRSLAACNAEFTYNGTKPGRVKLWIRYNNAAPIDWEDKPSSASERTYPQRVYNREDEERADENNYNSDNNSDVEELMITDIYPSSPDQDEWIDVTVEAVDNDEDVVDEYRGTVKFSVQRRDNSNDKWISASSSLYSLARTSYTFTSSDDGEHEFSNLVKFLNDNYDYRLVIEDDDDNSINEGYQVFDFGNGYDEDDDDEDDNETDSFYITVSTSSPSEDQYVDVTVRARDGSSTNEDYRGTVKFKVERKSGSSWTSASSSYYTLSTTSYTFTSNDDGIHEFSDLIRFRDDRYDYRLVIYDTTNDIEEYKIFYVNSDEDDNDDTDYDTDSFTLSTDDTTPDKNQYVDLTITAKDGSSTDTAYRNKVEFEVRYKEPGYSTRYKTTSLSHYEMKYPYEDNGYTFTTSNNGKVTITDFIRFKREEYQYKVIVIDDDDSDIEGEKIFTVNGEDENNDSAYNFYITADDSTPSTNQWIDLTVKARTNTTTYTAYRGTVQFEVYYKASGSSTWTRTTSSTYYEMNDNYEDGYTFTSTNNGTKTFTDFIKFKKTNYSYKVLVYDEDEEDNFEGEEILTVGSVSSSSSNSDVDGFTTSELSTVESIYDSWNSMISNLESRYPRLKTNTSRQNRSDDLYEQMGKVLDDDNSREYDDFDEFYDAWLDWYNYTISVR